MVLRELVRVQIALNGGHCPTQFLPVVTVAWVAEAAEPLMGMGLQDRAACADHFPALAPGVARSTKRAQAPRWRRPISCLRQSPLAGRLSCAINIEDEKMVLLSVPQSAWLLLFDQSASQQIVQKEGSQGL